MLLFNVRFTFAEATGKIGGLGGFLRAFGNG